MGKFNERVDVAKNELAAEMREAEARKAKRVKSAEGKISKRLFYRNF